jgi:hypothetical protein
MEHINTLCGQCYVKAGGTYSCHWVEKGKQVKKTVIFRGPENVNTQEIKIGDPVLRRKLLGGISVLEINPTGMQDEEDVYSGMMGTLLQVAREKIPSETRHLI